MNERTLTPEQRAEIERLKAAGQRRMILIETPEQRAETQRLIAAEEAAIPANIEYFRRVDAATSEPGFSGDLRRAIRATLKSPRAVAQEAGLDPGLIRSFCCGEAILTNDVIDRLVAHLGLRLTQVEQ